MFALQNAPTLTSAERDSLVAQPSPGAATAITLKALGVESRTARFELTMSVREQADGLSGVVEYNTDLFDATTIQHLLGHFRTLLEGIAADPSRRLANLPLLTEAERRQLLVEWNATGDRGQGIGDR